MPDPWPTDAVTNYSDKYGIGRVKSVGVDAAHNIWVLNGASIGVLRADTKQLVWTSKPIGQARLGFGTDKLATGSSVICGGKAGEAYVGYTSYDLEQDPEYPDLHPNYIVSPGQCYYPYQGAPSCYSFSQRRFDLYSQGDVDVVRLNGAGSDVELGVHISQSAGSSRIGGNIPLGIQNTNDYHYDEDRSVFSCVRVMKGPYAGEIYIGTNHGVTRIREYTYNSHRHPAWWMNNSQRAGYTYGLGISQDGYLLIGNDWKIGIIPPNASLKYWDAEERKSDMPADVNPAIYALNIFVDPVNPGPDDRRSSEAPKNYWRGFQETKDGLYYVGSLTDGLWEMKLKKVQDDPLKFRDESYRAIEGMGTNSILSLAASEDGSLFIGTRGKGLWRLKPDKTLEKVQGVGGSDIDQLVYDPTVTPGALYVLSDGRLFVLRGY
ncbi:hypothetical protein JY651_44815 [Pyxidicoccus parkwayensis]|uniref:Uncharacterized protein n=1 Tax=Pyxidicoccus parkwayensis TaxID=2813578 RepID=A0ABX7NUY2_9BACT|nr:hypothetical protein JY651_44815 [Pyxidicoccus parkwaysis]